MPLNRQQLRDEYKRLKKMPLPQLRDEMNQIHTRAYELAVKHYEEAMFICLTPKQCEAVKDKAQEIREQWDGITEITTDVTKT